VAEALPLGVSLGLGVASAVGDGLGDPLLGADERADAGVAVVGAPGGAGTCAQPAARTRAADGSRRRGRTSMGRDPTCPADGIRTFPSRPGVDIFRSRRLPMRIHELLRTKGFHVITVRPSATVLEVVELLKEYNLGAVVVSQDGRKVSGIVTVRDTVRRLLDGTDFLTGPVSAIMTSDVQTCTAQDSVRSL